MENDAASAAEQRANAVAKLKRAASLPRMKDGRRPPMRVEAVSDGEKFQAEELQGEVAEPPQPELPVSSEAKPETVSEHEQKPGTPEPLATARKRRSRSRSRSRGSKDFKGKFKPQSPTPASVTPSNDSSPDDSSPSPPPPPPSVLAPIPSHITVSPASRLVVSPNFLPPGAPLHSGTSSPVPMWPTLDAIHKGLIRSNSVAARMQALQKLTGNIDPQDGTVLSPSASPQPIFGKLGRNNTVSGGERSAARLKLFTTLNERIKEADVEGTSGGEDRERVVHTPPKRRRRRSARHSAGAANRAPITDESSGVPTSTSSPAVPPAPLPSTLSDESTIHEPARTASETPIPAQSLTINLNDTIAGSRGATPVRADPPSQRKRRSVLVEPDDDVIPPHHTYPGLPVTPKHPSPSASPQIPHSSDDPSCTSSSSTPGAVGVPVYLSVTQRTPSRQDAFPSSPFATPHTEISISSRDEEEDVESENPEEVVYPAENLRRSPYHDAFNRQISWIADPVPESTLPVYDEDEDDDEAQQMHDVVQEEDDQQPPESPREESGPQTEASSPRQSSDSKDLVVEQELFPEPATLSTSPAPSPMAVTPNTTSVLRSSDESDSSQPAYPQRLSVASRIQSDRSPLNAEFDLDNPVSAPPETPLKRDGSITGAWGRFMGALTRSASSGGRRSRTNSLAAREQRQNTDSGISRESGGSLVSPKVDKHESIGSAHPPSQSVMQSSSASASMQSLALQTPPRSGVSPIPPVSSADLAKYNDAKLFPFPGMKKLEEQRRYRGLSVSSSAPDFVQSLPTIENDIPVPSSSNNTPSNSPDLKRDRTLSHQASDTHLLAKFKNLSSPPLSTSASTSSRDHFGGQTPTTPQSATSVSIKLPTNREGVRKWLSKFGQSTPSLVTPSMISTSQGRPAFSRKPSLSDLLRWRKENDITSDWEEISSEKARTPTSAGGGTFLGKPVSGEFSPVSTNGSFIDEDTQKTPRASKIAKSNDTISSSPAPLPPPSLPSPLTSPLPELVSSATPEPWSSLSDYPPPTTSESSSNTSSQYSDYPAKGAVVLECLNDMISRGPRSSAWPTTVDDPPRKLILAAPVLQVVNANTVKDRFLMLFSDLLIITKPVVQDPDVLLELTKPNPSDRKFIVKNVILLRNLCFSGDREDPQSKFIPRNPFVVPFVEQFGGDPDRAIVSLFNKCGQREDPAALAQLLFRTPEIDRGQLGDYLSRRSSRVVLKYYLDAFGFTSVRVDKALRIFLQTIHIPTQASYGTTALDTVLDSFASRWYKANASLVAYDKDLAYRFTRAIVQLNEVLHGAIISEPGPTGYVRRNVTARDFLDAFRRQDPRSLLSDDLIGDVYDSIRRERLCVARHPSNSTPADISITFKRPLPPRLTYRVQSEPVVVRIPQPDPNFAIELFGQDLIFEPPILTFAKSPEVSFRITGTSFGLRTMTMLRCGPNALLYTGLPPSFSISVERAFMRNTFQIAFLNHANSKRRYMFSFADPLVRHEWATSLKRLMEAAVNTRPATGVKGSLPSAQARFNQAVGDIAFKVLQETLIGPEVVIVQTSASKLKDALKHLAPPNHSRNGSQVAAGHQDAGGLSSDLVRSKSRSRTYYRHGAGKLELDSTNSAPVPPSNWGEGYEDESTMHSRRGDRIWSGKDLEVFCRQNSSIAQVLELLLPTTAEPAT